MEQKKLFFLLMDFGVEIVMGAPTNGRPKWPRIFRKSREKELLQLFFAGTLTPLNLGLGPKMTAGSRASRAFLEGVDRNPDMT